MATLSLNNDSKIVEELSDLTLVRKVISDRQLNKLGDINIVKKILENEGRALNYAVRM